MNSGLNSRKITQALNFQMLILGIVYAVGIAGILSPWQTLFLALTPINLLLTLFMALRNEEQLRSVEFLRFAIIAWSVGFFVEVAGVHTGKIFGIYSYGKTLGIKFLEVPLLIGVNWLILTYCAGELVRKFLPTTRLLKAFITAALMVGLDFFIEPVAIKLDFWTWEGPIPLQNFVAWGIVAFLLALVYHGLPERKINHFAIFTFIVQIVFFVILNIGL